MTNLYIIRHGEAAATWDKDADPALSDKGVEQAKQAAQELKRICPDIENLRCYSSPIKRAYQTAEIVAGEHGLDINIAQAVAEIPNKQLDMKARLPWLKEIMSGSWNELSEELQQWRQACIDFVSELEHDSVIFSHYIAINVLIGHCQQNNKVISYHPDNCSIHQFETKPELTLIKLGKQAQTVIN